MKTLLKVLLPLVLLAGLGILVSRQFTVQVLVAPASTGTAVNAVTGTVEVMAAADLHVKAQQRGQIARPMGAAGRAVEAGEVVAVQDSEELDLRIEQARIRSEAAAARKELESPNRIDIETLDAEIEGVRLAVELQQAPVSRLENLLRERRKRQILVQLEEIQRTEDKRLNENQLAQLLLLKEQMTSTAPFDGVIAEINAFRGDLVNPGQNLVRLVAHGRFVQMELAEEDYHGVRDGQAVTLRLASYPDRTFSGTVSRLADVANPRTKTRNVIVNLPESDTFLAPGLSGEGYLVKDERPGAVLVPRRALIGDLVYVARSGRVEVRRVRPGYLGLMQAEILEGVRDGELVILEDQNLLRDGDRVKTVQAGAR